MEVFQSLVPLLQDIGLRAVHGLYHPNFHFPFCPARPGECLAAPMRIVDPIRRPGCLRLQNFCYSARAFAAQNNNRRAIESTGMRIELRGLPAL